MENKKLHDGIAEIKKIKMTSLEKGRILENVLNFSLPDKKPVYSPWMTYSFVSILKQKQLVYFIIVPLILVLTSGGVVFASQESLPNSPLYPIKVNIVEPIEAVLSFSPESKAKFESNLATKRMLEAETLANQGNLNKTNEKKINDLLEKHTLALNKAINETRKTKSNENVDEIITNFQAGMNAHARVLDYIVVKEDKAVISNENNQISNTARVSAGNIRINSKNKEFNKGNKGNSESDKYTKRKDAIQSLITKTADEIGHTSSVDSPVKQKIIDDTNKTLDEAKNYLNEADVKVKEGNSKDAYSSLLDSESSIKEANIFLKTGLKFKDSNNGWKGNHKED